MSLSLGELVRWGAVRKTWRPGERKDFYQAESNVWKLLRRVYERRELNLIREAIDAFGDAQRHLDETRSQLGRGGSTPCGLHAQATFASECAI